MSELLLLNEQFFQLISEMVNKRFPTGTYAKTLGVVVINIDKCVLQSALQSEASF